MSIPLSRPRLLFALALLLAAVVAALDGRTAVAQAECLAVSFETPLGADESEADYAGRWSESGCRASLREGAYASAAAFSLEQRQAIAIRLYSIDADPYLYLLDEAGEVIEFDDDGGAGLNSRIDRVLPAGHYYALATTFAPGETGQFALVIGVVDTDPCAAEALGAVAETIWTSGEWSPHDCDAEARQGAYADTHAFTLEDDFIVTIDLESNADSYLFLTDADGRLIAWNDDGGDGHDARIQRRLPAGGYHIIATTFGLRERGRYWLSVAPSVGDLSCNPTDEPELTLREITYGTSPQDGNWSDDYDICAAFSARRIGTYTDAYRLLFPRHGFVTISLASDEADTYMFLTDMNGNVLVSDDDGGDGTNSRIHTWLPAGEYIIEATTYEPGECCAYRLEIEEFSQYGPDPG